MASATITVRVLDTEEGKALIERAATMKRILSTLFTTEVVHCHSCGCPVVRMDHLSLEAAKILETEVRALLKKPAIFPDKG